MKNEKAIREQCHLVWRNLTNLSSTFGPCLNGCGRSLGRGGGPCIACVREELAKLVGEDLAGRYVDAVRNVRDLEAAMGAAQ